MTVVTQCNPQRTGSTTPGALPGADVADPARIARLAEDARRAYEFTLWAFGPPSRGPAQRTRELAANPGPSTNTPAIPIAATAVALRYPERPGAKGRDLLRLSVGHHGRRL